MEKKGLYYVIGNIHGKSCRNCRENGMTNGKTKVCVIGPLPPPMTGLSKALDTIVRSERCREELELHVIDLGKMYTVSGGGVSFSKLAGISKLIRSVKQTVKKHDTDTYYLTIAQSTVGVLRDLAILRILAKDRNCRNIVIHLHGGGFAKFYQGSSPLLRKMIRKYYSCVTKAIVLGDSLNHMFDGILPREKVTVIPNCADEEFLLSEAGLREKTQSFAEKRTLQVLYLSNMIREKGCLDVLSAAEQCAREKVPVRFVFAGKFYSEEEQKAFGSRLAKFKIEDYVNYIGVVSGEKKRTLLKESDVFVLPTYYPHEGQPITILEAMAAGMPVICTAHAGIPDLVKDGRNGIFVPPMQPEKITEAVKRLEKDRPLMRKMAEMNAAEVKEKYTEERYLENIISVLK